MAIYLTYGHLSSAECHRQPPWRQSHFRLHPGLAATARVRRSVAELRRAGRDCWLDTSDIAGGEVWQAAIAEGIERAYAVVTLVSTAANASKWVRVEYLLAEKRGKPIVRLLAGDCELPLGLLDLEPISIYDANFAVGVQHLLRSLPAPPVASAVCAPAETQRAAELAYLRRLQLGELVHTELYTPMAGVARVLTRAAPSATLPAVVMHPELRHLRSLSGATAEARSESRPYEDIAQAFVEVRRAVLLGEPGAGKTTTRWKLAHDALDHLRLSRLGRSAAEPGRALRPLCRSLAAARAPGRSSGSRAAAPHWQRRASARSSGRTAICIHSISSSPASSAAPPTCATWTTLLCSATASASYGRGSARSANDWPACG